MRWSKHLQFAVFQARSNVGLGQKLRMKIASSVSRYRVANAERLCFMSDSDDNKFCMRFVAKVGLSMRVAQVFKAGPEQDFHAENNFEKTGQNAGMILDNSSVTSWPVHAPLSSCLPKLMQNMDPPSADIITALQRHKIPKTSTLTLARR